MKTVIILLGLILLCSFSLETRGVDYSERVSTKAAKCLVRAKYRFAIVRGFQSTNKVDPNVRANIQSAWAGGMRNVDVYMFPCVKCGNPKDQVSRLIKALGKLRYGMIWIDIEILNWYKDFNANRKFILSLVSAFKPYKKRLGIYTNLHNWSKIVGIKWQGLKTYPLWYAHYDKLASFKDFKSFGGWKRPSIKQYVGDTKVCGVKVDLNFY